MVELFFPYGPESKWSILVADGGIFSPSKTFPTQKECDRSFSPKIIYTPPSELGEESSFSPPQSPKLGSGEIFCLLNLQVSSKIH